MVYECQKCLVHKIHNQAPASSRRIIRTQHQHGLLPLQALFYTFHDKYLPLKYGAWNLLHIPMQDNHQNGLPFRQDFLSNILIYHKALLSHLLRCFVQKIQEKRYLLLFPKYQDLKKSVQALPYPYSSSAHPKGMYEVL